jgi:hypothetical protein
MNRLKVACSNGVFWQGRNSRPLRAADALKGFEDIDDQLPCMLQKCHGGIVHDEEETAFLRSRQVGRPFSGAPQSQRHRPPEHNGVVAEFTAFTQHDVVFRVSLGLKCRGEYFCLFQISIAERHGEASFERLESLRRGLASAFDSRAYASGARSPYASCSIASRDNSPVTETPSSRVLRAS